MEQFLGYAVPGIPYGCVYAIVAVGLVLTYQATGVFNFAFGAQAYTSVFFFTLLTQNDHLPVWLAFVISVVLLAPALGLIFDRFLFRLIPNSNTVAKIVVGISLLVGVTQLLPIIFPQQIDDTTSILFNPNTVYFHLFGDPINGIQLAAPVATVVVLVALVGLMRFTNLGLQMRGAVESRRLVQLDGVNAGGVVALAWGISSFLAGLAGVLLAPNFTQVSSQDYITLFVAAIAAAAVGALRSMPIAAVAAILMGVVELTLQSYLPTTSILYTAILPSFPFLVLVLALLFVPDMRKLDQATDPLSTVDPPTPPTIQASRDPRLDRIIKAMWYTLLGAFIVSMLTWMPVTWETVFNSGIALAIILLSITLVTGMAGQLSLAQASLAGVGAFTAAQLAKHFGLSMLLGGLVGAALAAVVAVILAVLSLRLRGLGLALMTLAAALFFDNTVFNSTAISNGETGLAIKASWAGPFNLFAQSGHSLFLVSMIALVVITLGVIQIRRGTIGRYLGAMRGSETGASGLGINLTWQRIMIFAVSGVVAGIGGTLLSIQQGIANPSQYNYEWSLIFVVLVVCTSVSTVEGAMQGAFGFVVVNELLVVYAPGRLSSLTIVLFAFGALQYAQHPEGVLDYQKRLWTLRFQRLIFRDKSGPSETGESPPLTLAGVDRAKSPVAGST